MAILITGIGQVGAFVARELVARGETPVVYDVAPNLQYLKTIVDPDKIKLVRGDILDFPELIRLVMDENIDRVIHTAAFLTTGTYERPHLGIKINIEGTVNVLEAARIANMKRVVFCSTSTINMGLAATPQTEPMKEDFACNILTNRPLSPYTTSKLTGEFLGLNYFDRWGVDFVAARFAGVFGPWIGVPGAVPGRLMRAFVEGPALGKPATIDTDLTYAGVCDLVSAHDAARGLILACDADSKQLKTRVYNITMGSYTFPELVDTAQRMFPGIKFKVGEVGNWGLTKFPYPWTQPLDTSAARDELGYSPSYDLESAMSAYADWVRATLS